MKKKVLIVHNYYQIPGGEDTVVANESKLLRDNGHEVIIYKRDNKELNAMSTWRKLLLPFTTIYNPHTAQDIKRIIKEEHIDVVHVHNTLNLVSASVYYAAISCKVPVVQTIHNYRLLCPKATFYRDGKICEKCVSGSLFCGIKGRCYRDSLAQTLVCATATKLHRMMGIYRKINYICLTDFAKDKLLSLNSALSKCIFDPDRIYVKPNFMPDASVEIVPAAKRDKTIVFAGRLDESKGVDVLLKAWDRVCENSKEAALEYKLLICGEGPMLDWCKEYVCEHELNNTVIYGKVPHDEVLEILERACVMVLPTRWYEGFPMSIAESYSVGTPVIGPDMGNVGNIIIDGVTGLKYEDGSIEGLAEVIGQFVLSNREPGMEVLTVCDVDKQEDNVGLMPPKSDVDLMGMYEGAYKEYRDKYTDVINYKLLMNIYDSITSN